MSFLRTLSTRALIGLAAATLVTGGVIGGAVVKVSSTGSTPSAVTGPDAGPGGVASSVQRCKAQLPPGHHGIGPCVSAVARGHGQHGAHGRGDDAGEPDDNGAAPKPSGSPSGAATVAPTAHPSASPSGG